MKKEINAHSSLGRPKGSGSQLIYDKIRHQILTLCLRPGTDIEELSLVSEFGVSRTPVREALIRLEADGLVQIVPNRGARVAALDIDNVGEMFEALDLYSRAIAHLASKRQNPIALAAAKKASAEFADAALGKVYTKMGEANWRFHLELGRVSENKYLTDAQTRIMNETMRLAYLIHHESGMQPNEQEIYFSRLVNEHEQLISFIESGEHLKAEELAGKHAHLFQENVSKYILRQNLTTIRAGSGKSDSMRNSQPG
jgi:DNA-binding GntR family transcriptional regulator